MMVMISASAAHVGAAGWRCIDESEENVREQGELCVDHVQLEASTALYTIRINLSTHAEGKRTTTSSWKTT
jgi:hypothetical protein